MKRRFYLLAAVVVVTALATVSIVAASKTYDPATGKGA